ncbi:MAG: hypothetical protein MK165_08505 [Pirellulaceae bacterium]|nr:hypothetical protein [Pirellulaceae bacterium]
MKKRADKPVAPITEPVIAANIIWPHGPPTADRLRAWVNGRPAARINRYSTSLALFTAATTTLPDRVSFPPV